MVEIVWAPKARDDLRRAVAFIAEDAPAAARRFAEHVFRRLEVLSTHPLLGSFIAEDDRQIYREVLYGNYRVIYRYSDDVVHIVAVHHGARLLGNTDLG